MLDEVEVGIARQVLDVAHVARDQVVIPITL